MDCHEAKDWLPAMYMLDDADAAECGLEPLQEDIVKAVNAHVAQCAGCREERDRLRQLLADTEPGTVDADPEEVMKKVSVRVLERVDAESVSQPPKAVRPIAIVLPFAAAIVLGVGLFFVMRPEAPAPAVVQRPVKAKPVAEKPVTTPDLARLLAARREAAAAKAQAPVARPMDYGQIQAEYERLLQGDGVTAEFVETVKTYLEQIGPEGRRRVECLKLLSQSYGQLGERAQEREAFATYLDAFEAKHGKAKAAWEARVQADQIFNVFNDHYDALHYYELITKRYPGSDESHRSYYMLGQYHERVDKLDKAATAYRDVIARFADSPWAMEAEKALARVLFNQNEREAAYAAYEAFIAKHPEQEHAAWARFQMGLMKYHSGMAGYPGAIADFRETIASYPETVYAKNATVLLAQLEGQVLDRVLDDIELD